VKDPLRHRQAGIPAERKTFGKILVLDVTASLEIPRVDQLEARAMDIEIDEGGN
jgi:hypothetical protein